MPTELSTLVSGCFGRKEHANWKDAVPADQLEGRVDGVWDLKLVSAPRNRRIGLAGAPCTRDRVRATRAAMDHVWRDLVDFDENSIELIF
jgi:hypothetical protein